MDFQFFGANCFRLSTKTASLIVDDNLTELGSTTATKPGDIALFTGSHKAPKVNTKLVIDSPGEYEVSDVSIFGFPVRAHMDEQGQHSATMYRIIIGDTRIAVTGHIYPELSDDELEALGTVDVLVIPVGGNGYTLDAIGALKIVRKIDPKLVIPTHFADAGLNYQVPQQDLSSVLHTMSVEPSERTTGKMRIKQADFGDTTKFVVVDRK